jgi:ElaB/YqjD/DUF883 family membrane-anchored ribosome-binding protein
VSANEQSTRTPAEIRSDIEQTREELGDTVEALAAKTDVKARVHERVEETKEAAREKISGVADKTPDSAQSGASAVIEKVKANPVPFAAGAALLLAFFIGRRSAMP